MECPECGANLVAGGESETEEAEMTVEQIAASAIETAKAIVNESGELTKKQANLLLDALKEDLGKALSEAELTKKVSGRTHARSDFLVVEDPEKTDTWHLPVRVQGKPDHRLMGGAWAALHQGFRGQPYQGPDKAEAISKLRALYKSEDMPLPGEKETKEMAEAEAPGTDQILAVLAFLATQYVGELPETEAEEEVTEAELAESASGAAISLVEAEPNAHLANPLQLDIAVIKPGWGNKKQNRYYGHKMLKHNAPIFKGAKMHAVGHDPNKKDVRTEVSQILDCPVGFTENGEPIARVGVFDETFAQSVRNRAALGTLKDLHCSILGSGNIRQGKAPDGKSGNIVESITEIVNVDWVMKAGAGGHALNLAEDSGGNDMADETQETEEQEETQEPTEEVQETEVVTLAESEVETALEATNLPGAFKTALSKSEYVSQEVLQEAIKGAVAEVKKLTGSGQPFGQGGTQPVEDAPLSEADKVKRFNDIMAEVGMAPVPVPE